MVDWIRRGAAVLVLSTGAATAQTAPIQDWRAEVFAAECAFARSMAERDFAAFGRLVAEDTLFFGARNVLRGKAAVLEGWKAFFDGPAAPFSWEPDQVEVLASGQLALSTGPVRNPRVSRSRASTRSGSARPTAAGW